jgi:hypothetical protein
MMAFPAKRFARKPGHAIFRPQLTTLNSWVGQQTNFSSE